MAIPLITIPPAENTEQLRRALQVSFNRLVDQINLGGAFNNFDFRENRGVNLSWPSELHDAVNVEYLESQLPKARRQTEGGLAFASGSPITYTPTLSHYGLFTLDDFVVTSSPTNVDSLHVIVAYVDETETSKQFGQLSTDMDGTTDPVVASSVSFSSDDFTNFVFSVNDFVVFDDPTQGTGTNTDFRAYEVAKITAISGSATSTATYTMARAQWGSFIAPHLAGVRFYPIKIKYFGVALRQNGQNITATFPSKFDFVLPSACVVSVTATTSGNGGFGAWTTMNCSKLAYPFLDASLIQLNPAPGFRTCNGTEYFIPLIGLHAAGKTSPVRAWVSENASIRNVVANLTVAPVGNTTTFPAILGAITDVSDVYYVLYIEPLSQNITNSERRVAVLDQLGIKENLYSSFLSGDVPNFRRMPYAPKLWPTISLPCVGTIDTIYDPLTGAVRADILPLVANGQYIDFQEGGELDAIVVKIGTTSAGHNATISIMT